LLDASIHTWEEFIDEFLIAFKKFDYDKLCEELNDIRMEPDESLEESSTRFKHLCYRFPLYYIPSISEWFQHLISPSNEQYQLIINKYESCIDTHLQVDLDLHENLEDLEVVS